MKPFLIILGIIILTACRGEEFKSKCGDMPEGNPEVYIRLIEAYPNPSGIDDYKEGFKIKNFGEKGTSLNGWRVIHSGNRVWELDQINDIKPCEEKIILSIYKASMNEKSDFLKLLDGDNNLVQELSWEKIVDGEIVFANEVSGDAPENKQSEK